MSAIAVTIYNDDQHGRDFEVIHLRPGHAPHAVTVVPDENAKTHVIQFPLGKHDTLIIKATGT